MNKFLLFLSFLFCQINAFAQITAPCMMPDNITLTGSSSVQIGSNVNITPTYTGTASMQYYGSWYKGSIRITNPSTTISPLFISNATIADAGTYTYRIEDGNNNNSNCYLEQSINIIVSSVSVNLANANPLCTDYTYNFPLQTNIQSETGPDYGCLGTVPNPAWYYLKIAVSGDINMDLYAFEDVDYIIWGPFNTIQTSPNALNSLNIIDCSYSSSNQEYPVIVNAQAGKYYMMLLTNYSNQVQNFSLQQVSGTGRTDCAIVTLCNVDIGADTSICVGASLPLDAGPGFDSYLWNTGATTQKISVSTAGSYFVTATKSGCTASDTINVKVNPKPSKPSVTNTEFCSGSTAPAWSSLVSGTNLKLYDMSKNVLLSNTVISNIVSSKYGISQTVNGCESDTAIVAIKVNPSPSKPSVTNTGICANATAPVWSSLVSGTNLKWYDMNKNALLSNPVISNTVSSKYGISQTVDGCESDTAVVTIIVTPIPSKPSVTNTVFCLGSTAPVWSSLVSGTNLKWYDMSKNVLSSNPVISNTVSSNYGISQSVNGCESDTAVVTINVNPNKPPKPSVTNTEFCSGSTAPVWSSLVSGTNLKWYDMSKNVLMSNPVISNTVSSNYGISQTVNGCEGDTAVVSITVKALPVATFIATTLSAVKGSTIGFSNNGGLGSYKWKVNNVDSATTQDASFTFSTSGSYMVTLISESNGCVDSTTQIITITEIKIECLNVPNVITPNSDGLNDTWHINCLYSYPDNEVVIFNRWGSIVYRRKGYNNDWDGGGLPDATYFYIIELEKDLNKTGCVTIVR